MKKNTITLIGLFVILLIAAFFVLQKPGERSANTASTGLLFTIDSLLVDKIEINTPASSLVLEKRGVEWFVAKPINYKADQANACQIIHQIKNLEIKDVISNIPEKQSVFQVDQTGIQIKVYEKGSEKAAFVLGKMAASYLESYARRLNSNDVLVVEGASSYMFDRSIKEWRDKTIFTTPKENIKEVRYQYGDTTFNIAFSDSAWFIGKDKAQQSVVEGVLSSLSNLQADDFIDSTISPKITALIAYAGVQHKQSVL